MDIMLPLRFYKDVNLLAQNRENREDASHIQNLLVENNIIPAFQIPIPFPGYDDMPVCEFKIYDIDNNETDLTSDITLKYDVGIIDGTAYLYITHAEESVTYDMGCYRAEFSITDGDTFYSIVWQNLSSTYVETYYRVYDNNGSKRISDTGDDRIHS